jgi:dTDP-4-dehydrorhamnose reductase
MSKQRTVLITGVSGLLGANLAMYFAPNSNCLGWFATNPVSIENTATGQMDVTDHTAVEEALIRIKPDFLIHCAAASDVDWTEDHPSQARSINEDATAFLARQSVALGFKLVFISSPFVFDGNSGNYDELDQPVPLNEYAAGKTRAEQAVLQIAPDALIIRACFYGHSPRGNHSLLEWVFEKAGNGEAVPGFTDSYFSPISVNDFVEALESAITTDQYGILHIGSSNVISKYEFIRMVLQDFDLDTTLLKPITVDEARLNANRPRDTSLNVTQLETIWGRSAPTAAEGMKRFASNPSPFST